MNVATIGYISIALMFVLLALRVPVAYVLFFLGIGGYIGTLGPQAGLKLLALVPYSSIVKYTFTVVPLFILMGHFTSEAEFTDDLFDAARKWFSGFTGGIIQATIAGCTVFAAACGSGMASCAAMAKIAIPVMLDKGCDKRLAVGTVAAGGTLAAMIPPSVIMVIYGILTGTPIVYLLIGGILPGLLCSAMYMGLVYLKVKKTPSLCPSIDYKPNWSEKFKSLKQIWSIVLLVIIVIGGMYAGFFTPTEAGGIGAFSALLIGLFTKRLGLKQIKSALYETARTSSMVFLIIAAAFVYGFLLSITRIPNSFSSFLNNLELNRYIILTLLLSMYIIMGCFMDTLPILIITIPLVLPAILEMGFDPVWFGILAVKTTVMGMVTPPFGLHLFIIKGTIPSLTDQEIMSGVIPFILVDIIHIAILIVFPQIVLFLPSLVGGY